jgi:uncharacterized cupredoxin-like copper-binding protein
MRAASTRELGGSIERAMRLHLIALSAAVLASACGASAPSVTAAAGRVVEINMSDYFFSPAIAEVRAGERVIFVLENFGTIEHEFMAGRGAVYGQGYTEDWLASARTDSSSGHDAGHTGEGVRIAPNGAATFTIVVPLASGDFEFGCFIAGHYESGMKGKLVVAPTGEATSRPVTPASAGPAKSRGAAPSLTPHPMGSMGDDDGEGH